MIQACSFGSIEINGKRYFSDLVIYPDGHIVDSWLRKRGHRLSSDDIHKLIESEPEIIIAGTGMNGLVKPEKELEEFLSKKGIRFIPASNRNAMELYNEFSTNKRTGACFHLTC